MNGKNRPSVASERINKGRMVSGNPIGKAFYQVLQLLHHIGVVREQAVGILPKSFSKKIDHLNAFVRPARPDSSINQQIKATNLAWATDMGQILLDHYQTTLNKIIQTLSNSSISKDNFLAAKQTALLWGKRNFGNKLQSSTVVKFGNIISNLSSSHKSPTQDTTRGTNGYYPAPRYTHNISSTTNIPGSTKILFRQTPATMPIRDTLPFIDSETFLCHIANGLDPASNDYLCNVCLPDSNATFPSGTHALAYSQAIFLDLGPEADAIFNAKTTSEVHVITERFPSNLDAWKTHAHGTLWQIFHWKMTNIPTFTQRLQNSGSTEFIDHSANQYWGRGRHGDGENAYGKSLSAFRDHRTLHEYLPQTAPPTAPTQTPIPNSTPLSKPTPAPRKRTSPAPWHPTPRPRTSMSLPIPTPTPNSALNRDNLDLNDPSPIPLYSTIVASSLNTVSSPKIRRTVKRNFVGRRPGPRCSHTMPSIHRTHQAEVANLISRPNSSPIPNKRPTLPRLMTQVHSTSRTAPSETRLFATGNTDRPRQRQRPGSSSNAVPSHTRPTAPLAPAATCHPRVQRQQPDASSSATPPHMRHTPVLAPTGVQHPGASMALPPRSPFSNANNRTDTHPVFTAKLQIHNNTIHKNADWTITKPDSEILIIGDLNLSRITTSPNDCVNIECFPGAKIAHIRNLLTKLENQSSSQPECVILSIGINDRENNPTSTSIPNIRRLATKATQIFPQALIAIPQINIPDHLSDQVKHNLKQLNDSLDNIQGIVSLPQIHQNLFETTQNDIQWTHATANTLLTHWLRHLNC